MNARACWKIAETADGLSVVYVNLVDGIQHDCGVVRRDTLPALLIEFIADQFLRDEGGLNNVHVGDVVVWNGRPISYLLKEARA